VTSSNRSSSIARPTSTTHARLPPGVAARAAALVVEVGGLGATSRVLEVGVGTGARCAAAGSARVERRGRGSLGSDVATPLGETRRAARRGGARRRRAAPLPCRPLRRGDRRALLPPRCRAGAEALAEVARVFASRRRRYCSARDEPQDAWRAVARNSRSATRSTMPGVSRSRFFDFPADEGWSPLGERHRIAFPRRIRPRQILERLAERSWSITWRMSDAQIGARVEALRPELGRALRRPRRGSRGRRRIQRPGLARAGMNRSE